MRVDVKQATIKALFVSLCCWGVAHAADAGVRADPGAPSSASSGAPSKPGTGTGTPSLSGVAGSTSSGAGERAIESTPAPAHDQMNMRSVTDAPPSGSGLKKPY